MNALAKIIYEETGLTQSSTPDEYEEVASACRRFALCCDPRQPLSDEEVKAICYTGPVYAPDGKVTRTPEQYKREIADARMHGVRQAERAHGIGGEG